MSYAESVTSIERGIPMQRNIQIGLVGDLVSRSAAPPATAKSGRLCNITLTTKPWQPFAHRITDPQAAVAVSFHALHLGGGEHGVRHQLVVMEHGIVVPSRHVLDSTQGAQA